MSLKQDIHHFLNLYFVAFMSCRFTWEHFDCLIFVLILVALLIQYVTSGRWGPVDLGPSHTRFGGLRLGQGASCPLSLCGPPPSKRLFPLYLPAGSSVDWVCDCLYRMWSWVLYVLGGLFGSPVAWVWDLSALEVTPTWTSKYNQWQTFTDTDTHRAYRIKLTTHECSMNTNSNAITVVRCFWGVSAGR